MRRRGWWMTLIGMMVMLCMATSVSAAATTYTDPQGRFSFTVPDGYQKTDVGDTRIAYISPTYARANVIVSAHTGASGTSLDDTASAILKTAEDTLKDFQPGPNGIQTVTIAGKSARRYEYTATIGGAHVHGVQYLVINGDTGYFLTFTASEADFTGFVKESMGILDSFTFLSGTGAGVATTTPPTAAPSAPPTSTTVTTSPPVTVPTRASMQFFIHRLGDG
jgi:photosystem II reaction center protein PsbP